MVPVLSCLKILIGTKYREIDYPMFWGHAISEIERIGAIVGNGEGIVHLPLSSFPKYNVSFILKEYPDVSA